MRPNIFVTQPIPEKALARLREAGNVEVNPDSTHIITKPALIAALKPNDYLFCLLHDIVDAEVINSSPNLKLIASMAIIPAGIDVASANARRIPVTAVPPFVTEATADLHWALRSRPKRHHNPVTTIHVGERHAPRLGGAQSPITTPLHRI